MTQFTPAMDAALAQPTVVVVGAIEIVLPEHTIRVLTGSGQISFGGKTFTGADDTYGTLVSVEDLTDGTGDDAPALQLSFAPASNAAAASLGNASHQGSAVTIWLCVVDPASGLVVPDPLAVFLGALDVTTFRSGDKVRLLDMEVTSAFEQFFFNDDGARLSDQFHEYCWPGETGLNQVSGIEQHIYWGAAPPTGVSR